MFTKLVVWCRNLSSHELKLVNRALKNDDESCLKSSGSEKSELVELMKSIGQKVPNNPSELFQPIVCCVCNNLCNEMLTCQSRFLKFFFLCVYYLTH